MAYTQSYCGKCGHSIESGSTFCGQCGNRLSSRSQWSVRFGPVVAHQGNSPERIEGMLDAYVILEQIGEGGMGCVYRAMDPNSGQEFAIKIISEEFRLRRGNLDPLAKEAQAQSEIVHPNVVRVFRLFENQGKTALVLELVRGKSLEQLMTERKGRPISILQVLWLADQMVRGLNIVHEHGLIHADVKPGNFLFGHDHLQNPVLKVADFGIAKSLREQLTGKGSQKISGTPGYMSPEQIRGDPMKPTSDIYSLGCVFYELLTGQPVFPYQDFETSKRQHLYQEPPNVLGSRPDTPAILANLVSQMTTKDAAKRPQNTLETYQVLNQINAGAQG